MSNQQPDSKITLNMKIVLLGQTSVGKSSLVLRFVQNQFYPNTEGTIGAAYLTKNLDLEDGTQMKLEIWDTAGQERYHSLAPMYYRGAHAAIVVYDVASRDSFDKVKSWVRELQEKSTPDQVVAVVGNKVDLPHRVIDKSEALKYTEENGLLYMETSAKDGTNVSELFELLASKVPKASLPRSTNSSKFLVTEGSVENSSGGCPC